MEKHFKFTNAVIGPLFFVVLVVYLLARNPILIFVENGIFQELSGLQCLF
jgi:hypothetical protein